MDAGQTASKKQPQYDGSDATDSGQPSREDAAHAANIPGNRHHHVGTDLEDALQGAKKQAKSGKKLCWDKGKPGDGTGQGPRRRVQNLMSKLRESSMVLGIRKHVLTMQAVIKVTGDGLQDVPGSKEERTFLIPGSQLRSMESVCLSSSHSIKALYDVPAGHGLVPGPHKPSHDT